MVTLKISFSISLSLDPCEGSYLAEHDSLEDCLAYWESTIELQEESGKNFSLLTKKCVIWIENFYILD